MGLLDFLKSPDEGGGIGGGLLDYLYNPTYQSPLQTNSASNNADFMRGISGEVPDLTPQSPWQRPGINYGPASAPSPFAAGAAPFFATGLPQSPAASAPSAQPVQAPQQPTDIVNPINVGSNYQMPRIGSPDEFQPQQVNTPPNAIPTQGQMPQGQPANLPPAFGGSNYLERLNAGGGLIGSLLGDTSQQKNLKAQYDALVPIVGQQKAMLAVLNPEAGKTILAQALEKKQYGFQKLDSDTIVRTDPLTGKAEVAFDSSDASRTVAGPDGKPIPIPPGVDRKTFVNEVSRANAKAAAGEKTEVQAKAEIFANKMELSGKTIDALGGTEGTSLAGKIASGVPLGNYAQSPEYQRYKQASSNFITALLRQESGAAISKSEFDRYDKEYMPQPGDSKEALTQKAEARRIAIEGMKKGAGPGYKSPTESPSIPSSISDGATATNPQTGQKIIFRNGKWSSL